MCCEWYIVAFPKMQPYMPNENESSYKTAYPDRFFQSSIGFMMTELLTPLGIYLINEV